MTTRVPIGRRGDSYAGTSDFVPSPYWGTERSTARGYSAHNPMMDGKGRLWITQLIRPSDNPAWCRGESDHPSAKHFPIERSQRQLSYYDTKAEKFVLIDTCYMTHHQFADDENDTLWLSGSTDVVGWLNTRLYDETGDERAAQGWCPTIVDTNGDGRIAEYTEPDEPMDPTKDMRLDGFAYGIIPNPVDGSIWIARRLPVPGNIVRLDLGDNPPETCIAEVYEPPFENPNVDPSQWGHGGRGIDVDRNGLIWTALGGSGHLASFDRSKCSVLNGPTAIGQHCPEGWTLYQTPGPQMKGVTAAGSADFHYYNWVDQFNTLGLGENVPIANGTSSDSLLALLPETGEWVTLRVPYPQGFYTRGLDGRIDDPQAGWERTRRLGQLRFGDELAQRRRQRNDQRDRSVPDPAASAGGVISNPRARAGQDSSISQQVPAASALGASSGPGRLESVPLCRRPRRLRFVTSGIVRPARRDTAALLLEARPRSSRQTTPSAYRPCHLRRQQRPSCSCLVGRRAPTRPATTSRGYRRQSRPAPLDRLSLEPAKPIGISRKRLGQGFQGHLPVQLRIGGPVDLPHAALADEGGGVSTATTASAAGCSAGPDPRPRDRPQNRF